MNHDMLGPSTQLLLKKKKKKLEVKQTHIFDARQSSLLLGSTFNVKMLNGS